MGMTTAFANSILGLIFNGSAVPSIALNATATPATNLFVSLHSSDPGAAGNQTSNELSYTGYARATIARSSGGWTLTSNVINPASQINFLQCTGGSGTVAFWGIGLSSSGAGTLICSGSVSPNIAVVNGVTPQLTTASTITET